MDFFLPYSFKIPLNSALLFSFSMYNACVPLGLSHSQLFYSFHTILNRNYFLISALYLLPIYRNMVVFILILYPTVFPNLLVTLIFSVLLESALDVKLYRLSIQMKQHYFLFNVDIFCFSAPLPWVEFLLLN